MSTSHEFLTLDVFAARAFEGNQLAVLPDARGIPESSLLPITREFGFSETVFVLPGRDEGSARVRIFTLDGEADFAGHPLVGTACVLGERTGRDELLLDVPAGTPRVRVEVTETGLRRATVTTPRPLAIEGTVPPALVAPALGLPLDAVLTGAHPPTGCGLGRPYVITEIEPEVLDAAIPDAAAFARAREAMGTARFGVLAYARTADPSRVRARMFSPLTGTVEDAATGSANVALVALLLSLDPTRAELRLTSRQGERMGRPSTLDLHAWHEHEEVRASVAGTAVPVTRGRITLP